LTVDGGGDGIRRPTEGDKECVTLRVHLDSVMRRERGAQTPAMLVQGLAVTVTELL
jgi:hypothetical protein